MSFDLRLLNGDLNTGSNGDLDTVENGEKLTQDILKMISTDLGSNRNFPWYGCPISQSLVGRAFDFDFIQSVATTQLRYSISTLQKMQLEQLKQNQVVTAQEQIAAIEGINISRSNIDPRFFSVAMTVISKAFRRVPANFNVSL